MYGTDTVVIPRRITGSRDDRMLLARLGNFSSGIEED